MKKILFFSLILGLMLCAAPTLAAEYYIDATGGDDKAGDGSMSAPYKTYASINAKLVDNDTVYMKGDFGVLAINLSELSGVTVTNWPGETPVLQLDSSLPAFYIENGTNITMSGFSLHSNDVPIDDYNAISVNNSSGVTIENCTFEDVLKVYFDEDCTNATVHNNTFKNLASGSDNTVLDITASNVVVTNNVFESRETFFISLENVDTALIANNIFNSIELGEATAISLGGAPSNIEVYNNTFYRHENGVYIVHATISDESAYTKIYNNIFTQCSYAYVLLNITNPITDNNLFYNNTYAAAVLSFDGLGSVFTSIAYGEGDDEESCFGDDGDSSCSDLTDQDTCEAFSWLCEWGGGACAATNPENELPCDDIDSEDACNMTDCEWGVDDDEDEEPTVTLYEALADWKALGNDTNSKAGKPYFKDATNYDFSIKKKSKAIDLGKTLADVTTDIAGNDRPYGESHDAGAYENLTKDHATGKVKNIKVPKKLRKLKKVVVTFKKKKKSVVSNVKYQYKLMNAKGKKLRKKKVTRNTAHKSGKTKARITVKKLKQKKYKIRLRTVRTLNDVEFFSPWSKAVTFRPAAK